MEKRQFLYISIYTMCMWRNIVVIPRGLVVSEIYDHPVTTPKAHLPKTLNTNYNLVKYENKL